MATSIPISQKRGCGFNSLEKCTLIKASAEEASSAISDYFDLKRYTHCSVEEWTLRQQELQAQHHRKPSRGYYQRPLWQYVGHSWSIWPLASTAFSMAFAIAELLDTDVITFDGEYKIFNLFRGNRLVEIYEFGLECGTWNDGNWDLAIDNEKPLQTGSNTCSTLIEQHQHHFCSSIQSFTEFKVRSALANRIEDDKGFLDTLLRAHDVYLPDHEENPIYSENTESTNINNTLQRIDDIIVPYGWKYRSPIPSKVTAISYGA